MTDVKVPSSGNIRVWWAPTGSFANWKSPTAAEINATHDISDSISWNDFGFGIQASNTIDDPAITAIGKVSDRGASQFGGTISFYYPRTFDDAGNAYSLTYDLLDQPRTTGYILWRIDGEESSTNAVTGDLISVAKVITDGFAESIVGEEAFRYTVTFLSQGDLAVRAYVGATDVQIAEGAGATMTVGEKLPLHAYINEDRIYTNGLKWTSNHPEAATVSSAGVVTCKALTPTATITATYEATGDTATFLVND